MDKKVQEKENSSELRELLIAISQSEPDDLVFNSSEDTLIRKNAHCNGAIRPENDKVDQLRSQLISISDAPSPDKITLPAVTGP